jgi:putative transposase
MGGYTQPVHNRRSMRLKGFDYGSSGAYFVTIQTLMRVPLLGKPYWDEGREPEIRLSEFGKIVTEEWERSSSIRSEIELGPHIVMPDHFHGIVRIVGADGNPPPREFRSPSHTLGALVRGFKGAVTRRINILRGTPGQPVWQRDYYDHIIRTEREYQRLAQYIAENPKRWFLNYPRH